MKKAILILISSFALLSYSPKPTNDIFSGFWIEERYVKDVLNGVSVHDAMLKRILGKSHDNVDVYWFCKKTNDTAMHVWNFHEGNDAVFRKSSKGYTVHELSNDTLMDVKILGQNRIRINGKVFIRLPISTPVTNPNAGVLEYLLFKGKYRTLSGKEVELTVNGNVIGLDTIKYYDPVIDYIDPCLNLDMVKLMSNLKDRHRYYGFKFNKDTLSIYTLLWKKTDSTCEAEWNTLLYKLIKQK